MPSLHPHSVPGKVFWTALGFGAPEMGTIEEEKLYKEKSGRAKDAIDP